MAITQIPSEFISVNAISGTIIADNAITTIHIASNAVESINIAENNITAREIAVNTITGTLIADNAITAIHISGTSVTATQIQDNAIGTGQLAGIARGKIIYGDSSGNPQLLALGSNGQVLKSDGTDISWGAISNPITALNSATENELVTIGSTTTELNAESGLTWDTNTLAVTGAATVSTTLGVTGLTSLSTAILDGLSNYTGLEVKGAGAARPQVKFTNVNQGLLGAIYGTEGNALVISTGTGGATAITIDSSQNTTFTGVTTIANTSAANVNNESHVLIRNLANGNIVTDALLYNCAEDKFTVGGGTFITSGYIRSGVAVMQLGTASTGPIFTLNTNGRQTYNTSSTNTGHGNFVGEVGASMKALSFERTNGGGEVGYIVTNVSSTGYVTSSDYRLKENVSYTWDATTRLKQLKPARFNWIVDDTNTLLEGFLAHEVSDIVPEAVHGEKDAEEMQGIDQSKLVPLMVKTIQELEARIAALE